MHIAGSTALVTGANRGLGLAFARALLARGATRVYAAARDPAAVGLAGVVPLRLDVTNPAEVAEAARLAADTDLVINNAGVAELGPFLADGAEEAGRRQLEVNYFGPWRMARAFAPVLARNGGGALVNVLSVASWLNGPLLATYGATKAAAWALTNGLRFELEGQGTQVLGVHAGFIDTDLTRGLEVPKSTPEDIVAAALDALERGERQVLADAVSRAVHAGLSDAEPIYFASPEGLRERLIAAA